MDIKKIVVNTYTLEKKRDEMQKQVDTITKKMDEMKQEVEALNNMWTGSVNAAFNKEFNKDIESLLSVCEDIQKIVDYETKAIKEYNSCEKKVSTLIEELKV